MEELAGEILKRKRGRPKKAESAKAKPPTKPVLKIEPKPAQEVKTKPTSEPVIKLNPPKVEKSAPSDEDRPDLSYRGIHMMRTEGIPIRGLALLFGSTESVVKSRLRNLKPSGFGKHGNPLYIPAEAAPYIVDPVVNLKEFLSNIKDEDLPDDMRLKFWSARRQRNKTLIEEGELWHRSEVVAKFGEVLLAIREKLQLIPERIERMTGVTPEQYKMFRALVDSVQDEMHKTIIEMAAKDNTLSVLGQNEEDEVVL